MFWSSKSESKPKEENQSFERDLILGGIGSIALQNIFLQTQGLIRIFLRQTINHIYPNRMPYESVKCEPYEQGLRVIRGIGIEHLVVSKHNLYYIHPQTLKIYQCKKYCTLDDQSDTIFKVNEYIENLLKKILTSSNIVSTSVQEMMAIFAIHMLLNDYFQLFKKHKSNCHDDNVKLLLRKILESKTYENTTSNYFIRGIVQIIVRTYT